MRNSAAVVEYPADEIVGLVEELHDTQQRLRELTGGEVDAVVHPGGQSYLLHEAQEKLQQSEEKFRQLAANVTDVFFITSADMDQMHYVSPAYEQIWGRSVENLYANPHEWAEAILPEERERVFSTFSRLATVESSVSTQFPIARPDGTVRWIFSRGFQVRDAAGKVIRITGIASDITERKLAETDSSRLAAIIESSDDAIIGKDLNSIITSWNKGAEKIFGYAASEMLGTSIVRLIPADRWYEESQILEKINRAEGMGHFETLRQTKDGRLIDVSITASPIKDAAGKISGASKVARDITERKQAEAVLKESERRLREMLENVELLALTLEKDGTVTFCNDYLLRMTGWKREEALGADWFSNFMPENDGAARKLFFETIEAGTVPTHYENSIKTRTGELREIAWNNTMLRDSRGNIAGMACLGEDVTERNRAEARVRAQADIINRAHDAIIVLDFEDQRITSWNSGAERLYGWSADEATGRSICELIFADKQECEGLLKELASAGEFHGEIEQVAKDGRKIIVQSRATLVGQPDGTSTSGLFINTDVTEQKKLETQLLRAQRLESIGTLASGVAHDLNNILTPILMCSEMLKDSPRKDLPGLVSMIEQSAKRGTSVVKQVLTFARGIEGEHVLINPGHLVNEMVDIAQKTFPKSIEITNRYPEDLWSISCDPTQLHQVLLNLSVNARDAMPSGGSIIISAENFDVDEHYASMTPGAKPGPYVMFSVADTGAGMSRATTDKIFDPFFTTKEVGKGTGLGLSTALGIVKSHGGFIAVYSEVGRGTTFKVYLPAEAEDGSSKERETPAESCHGNSELILVVDDEPHILGVTKMVLEKNNYRVVCANDGPEALAIFAKQMDSIRAVLTDIVLPYMGGVVLIRAFKRMKPDMLFIASSGHGEQAHVPELQDLGVTNFLTKPYDTGKLLLTLKTAMEAQ